MGPIGFLIVLAALGYGTWAGFLTVREYIQVRNVVDQVLEILPQGRWDDPASTIRTSVIAGARDVGIPMEERDVAVSQLDRVIKVHVGWSHPVVVLRGETVLAIPIWVNRSAPAGEEAPRPRARPRSTAGRAPPSPR